MHKVGQSAGFFGRIFAPFLKTGLTLMKIVIIPFAKSVLIPLGLTAAAWVADEGKHKKILGSGTAALIISNEEMEDILKIVRSLEYSGLLSKWVCETIESEKGWFLSMVLGTLGALGNMCIRKYVSRKMDK